MKYNEIRFYNVGGIRRMNIPGSPVVMISGDNGTGKTSLIEGVSLLFDGGHNPDLIGPYDEYSTVEVDFDNGWKFRRTTTPKGYELKGWTEDGSIIRKPAETLKQLVSGLALNPTGLVDAPQKDRVKFLQNAMPLEFTPQEIAETLGQYAADVKLPDGKLDGSTFNGWRDGYYSKRTDLNRSIRDKEGTRNTLIKSLPPEDDTDWSAAAKNLRSERDNVSAQSVKFNNDAKAVLDQEIARLEQEAAERIADIKEQLSKDLAHVRSLAKEALDSSQTPLIARLQGLIAEISQAEEKAKQQERAKGVRESVERISGEEREMAKQASRLDRVIEKLDALKRQKLDALPIQGVEVRDGQIYYNGLNFDTQLNTAQQYVLSFQVAALTLGDLPLMLFDKAESLVGKARAEFIEGIKDAGFQVILAECKENAPLEVSAV